tara:strand:+ start:182 stop:529 length:348 start_codon:yes stop_codon:yes gene_type:complete
MKNGEKKHLSTSEKNMVLGGFLQGLEARQKELGLTNIERKQEVKMKKWMKKSAQDLDKFLEDKLENYVGEMFWLQNVGKIYLTENGDIDEITMQGEFNEEIDIVKEWIDDWKKDG